MLIVVVLQCVVPLAVVAGSCVQELAAARALAASARSLPPPLCCWVVRTHAGGCVLTAGRCVVAGFSVRKRNKMNWRAIVPGPSCVKSYPSTVGFESAFNDVFCVRW